MKGIILAGGSGTRLYPVTKAMSKQMVPIYDKPMIYYPMSVLMLAGIRDILIISTPRDIVNFKELFKDGSEYGLNIEYAIQEQPNGLAEAFIIGEEFIGDDNVAMILGDNIFYGQSFSRSLKRSSTIRKWSNGIWILCSRSKAFGVVGFDENGKVTSLEEKPEKPKSKYAVPGLYFYDNSVVEKAKALKPSPRGELEITDLNKAYMEEGTLKVDLLGRGMAGLIQELMYQCLKHLILLKQFKNSRNIYSMFEEIAYRQGWISKNKLEN